MMTTPEPHSPLATHQKLRKLGWEVLHPSYNPDLASDYHLFRFLQNSLNAVKLTTKKACDNHLSQFFGQKSQKFYNNGIIVLSQKWRNIVEENGIYLV